MLFVKLYKIFAVTVFNDIYNKIVYNSRIVFAYFTFGENTFTVNQIGFYSVLAVFSDISNHIRNSDNTTFKRRRYKSVYCGLVNITFFNLCVKILEIVKL